MADKTEEKFSLVIGGPFYRLQDRLGLLGPDSLPPPSTALLFAALAWLPPALLAAAQGLALNDVLNERSYLLDYGMYARFIISIGVFVAMERIAEGHISVIIGQFHQSGLVLREEGGRFQSALQLADRRSSSALAEAILLAASYAVSALSVVVYIRVMQTSWLGSFVEGLVHVSLAGWWATFFSLPLFWFLLLRWLWRFVVWSILLNSLAKLNMRLIATHPDRCGGIGFLGMFPPIFAPLVFALSCVTASVALQDIVFFGATLESMGALFGGWLVIVLVIFIGPILVFAPVLLSLKRRALLAYGMLSSRHNRAFEEKWVREEMDGKDVLGAPDISSLADLNASFDMIESMRPVPAGLETFIPLLLATCLPWLVVATTQVPLQEVLTAVIKALM